MTNSSEVKLNGIDYLEFTTDSLSSNTTDLFLKLGFNKVEKNNEQELYSQGQIRFLVSALEDKSTHTRKYFENHGEGVSKIAFKVDNVEQTLEQVLGRGAKLVEDLKIEETPEGLIKRASIQGFGDVYNEFVERPSKVFSTKLEKFDYPHNTPLKTRCSRIDHLTNNVPKGEMDHWVDFYQRIYGFKETRYFDIKGLKTGLFSKVVQNEAGTVIIPINEPEVANGKSQIQEFLDLHKGAGVQHIALMTPDIISSVSELQERGINYLDVPGTYYEDIPKRGLNVTEDLKTLEKYSLLVDGDKDGYLLQIFTKTYIGPLFFEYIQRKNHWGFGEGNFQALFDSIERDQAQRGYI